MNAIPARLTATLHRAPATVPCFAALALFVSWSSNQAGYPVTHWAPGALVVLALLIITVATVGIRVADVSLPVKFAIAALAGYTALSFLSILWAAVPGDAWEGADRTLLYLLVFSLFACWRQRGASAALLLVAWVLAMIGLAAFVALQVGTASAHGLQSSMPGGRLVDPSEYANANAAEWLMAFWPAALLARSRSLPWGLRGLLAGGAVLLACMALLSQSRGSLYATPVMVVLVFALVPDRLRTFALLVPIAAGSAAVAPAVLRVGEHLSGDAATPSYAHHAVLVVFAAAIAVAVLVSIGAAIESRNEFTPASLRRVRRGVGAVASAGLVAVVAGGLVLAGNPVSRVEEGWHSFKGGYGEDRQSGPRLTSGLGSNRYDFYRVALDEFVSHPILGIGADNFEEQYLRHGRSTETPHYPHSVELRTLSQTGLLGALLALVGLGAALLAGWRACRSPDPLGRAVAAAALAGFAYWLVHGSFDWFWEFAGLGAPAFALLGLACALGRARSSAPEGPERGETPRRPRPGAAAWLALSLPALAATGSLAAPWLSQLEVQSAARVWVRSPGVAYARLQEAARLNPLSDASELLAGSIALRYGDLSRASHYFSNAIARSSGDAYATLELGAIASSRGERDKALKLLARAAQLNPRDQLTVEALRLARAGDRIDIRRLNLAILQSGRQLA